MKKNKTAIVFLVVAIVAIIAGAAFYFYYRKKKEEEKTDKGPAIKTDAYPPAQETTPNTSVPVLYSPETKPDFTPTPGIVSAVDVIKLSNQKARRSI